jgi:hypothetical protein
MAEFPTVRVGPDAGVEVDLREDSGTFEFRLLKQRFADTFLRLDVAGRPRSWYLDTLLLEIARAGPEGALAISEKAGYRFLAGPEFVNATRGRIEVWGRLAPIAAVTIPAPSGPAPGS